MSGWDLESLDLLVATSRSLGQLERSLRSTVAKARVSGVSWEEVGEALGTARQSAWRRFKEEKVKATKETRVCSFCGKPQNKVRHLVAAPTGASICGGCLDVAARMVDEARTKKR